MDKLKSYPSRRSRMIISRMISSTMISNRMMSSRMISSRWAIRKFQPGIKSF